ncbi:hypothetical protein LP7551_03882 [Roseibium album]|nr:hypothetical protein LP7551_03882 [Roseibium album]
MLNSVGGFLASLTVSTGLIGSGIAADLDQTAQSEDFPAPKKWEFVLGVYGFLPWVNGTSGAASTTATLDLTGRDILDALRFAYFVDGEVVYDRRFSAMVDIMYANLGGASSTRRGTRIGLTFSEYIIEARAGYRFLVEGPSWLEAYGGVRYWDVTQTLSITGGGRFGLTRTGSAGDQWIDPIVGLRGRYGVTENWGLVGQGDIGGFGAGSDFSWRAQAGVQYAFENGLAIDLEYKALQVDFDNGKTGANRFVWDVIQHGPFARISYRF